MKSILLISLLIGLSFYSQSQYPSPPGTPGSTAIHKDSNVIVGWADRIISFNPGPQDLSNSGSPLANYGDSTNALGVAEGNSTDIVSLGDGGSIILGFPFPIMNGFGFDFVVFENSFSDDFLEFAHVEVSSDGITFIRIPSHSLVQTASQTGSFGSTSTTEINNLAGKYRQGFGTPFDLEDIIDSTAINLDSVQYIKLIDVVGSIDSQYGSMDSYGNYINEPFPTFFPSGGFDLDAIGMINVNGVYVTELDEVSFTYSVYPNPTNGILNISVDNMEPSLITLYNLDGQMIYQENFYSTFELNLTNLGFEKGIYIISITSNGNDINRKIVYK